MSTTITSTQKTLQSAENLIPLPTTGPTAQVFSQGDSVTQVQVVTSSQIYQDKSISVSDGTTADPNATYVGTNGGTPMFAIKNPNGSNPPNLNNALEAPPIQGSDYQGFDTNGKVRQGLLGAL